MEGKAVFDYLWSKDYKNLTICDQNVALKADLPEGVSVKLGKHYLDDLDEFEVLFRSPGVPFFTPQIQAALLRGTEVTSGTKYFMDQCPCPVIGVTGTKGKGTTCTLIYEMLKKGGKKGMKDVFLGGNIGKPAIAFLDDLKGDDVVVLELSSFQLQDLHKSPHYAVILNTTSDHLDYHVDRDEYLKAKEQLLTNQHNDGFAVLNKDYEYSKYYAPLVKGELKWVSVKGKVDGAYVKDDGIFYGDERVAEVAEVALVGSHNLENILPAVIIAKEFSVSSEAIAEVIKTFKNLPYRLQFVRELNGVSYYNDSYSTTPETSMAAVDSFDVPTVLIAGGYDKGLSYDDWAIKILTKPSLHTVILMGDTTDKMEKALVAAEEKLGDAIGSPTKVLRRSRMEDAVVDAYAESSEGKGEGNHGCAVVLSPGAASFDMYENYKERGNDFTAHVRKLK